MIIDTHIHFYESPRPGSAYTDPKDHLTFPQVLSAARSIGVSKIVQVSPAAVGYDNAHGLSVANAYPDDVLGVILRLDPWSAQIHTQLEAAMENPASLALRITLIDAHNVDALRTGALNSFFEMAQDRGVPIELFAPFRVQEMHATVLRFPGIRWLIDHMGLRYYAGRDNSDAFRQWAALLDLAREPNAWIKCSYFPEAAKDIESYPFPRAAQRLRELVDAAGSTRLIWGSNFPNVRRACSYKESLDFFRLECRFLSGPALEGLLGGNFLRYIAR